MKATELLICAAKEQPPEGAEHLGARGILPLLPLRSSPCSNLNTAKECRRHSVPFGEYMKMAGRNQRTNDFIIGYGRKMKSEFTNSVVFY